MSDDRRRLDQLLVDKGLAPSRTRAQDLIEAGQVFLRRAEKMEPLKKSSLELPLNADLIVTEGEVDRFVSRGGLKLEAALQRAGFDPKGKPCLDVGQSTGGFTDCLLQAGASWVVGVDVGHGQLNARISKDPRVRVFERVNAREMHRLIHPQEAFPEGVADLVVMDLSFISQTLIFPALATFCRPGTHLLSLVKPQFEVGPEGLGKGGIVRDVLRYEAVERKIKEALIAQSWTVLGYFESAIDGKDGNKEFFVHAVKN
jgi:23S rRNA (cytidine1920-2'-O)/16S rRNA (cytidine1409-2'-O)-methyltransferase